MILDIDLVLSKYSETQLNFTKKTKSDLIEYVITKKININHKNIENKGNEKRLDSLQRSARNIRSIIDNNLEFNDLILTLTFKENMTDYDTSDKEFKKFYPSLSALLPINRHLYDAHMIITTQDINRPYKLLRELQTDFAIKAISSHGFGYFWNAIPLLRFFSTTKYIYYENNNSALNGLLPFHAKGVVNETLKHGLLTAGQATKEVYEAQHGNIRYGRIFQLKKNINYDTRYFHKVVYNKEAPKN